MSKLKIYLLIFLILLIAGLATACSGRSSNTAQGAATDPQVEKGRALYTQNCASCHSTSPETVIVGPSLNGIANISASRVDGQDAKTYLELSIMAPGDYVVEGYNDLMPSTFGKTLSGEEFDALIEFLLTLE